MITQIEMPVPKSVAICHDTACVILSGCEFKSLPLITVRCYNKQVFAGSDEFAWIAAHVLLTNTHEITLHVFVCYKLKFMITCTCRLSTVLKFGNRIAMQVIDK